VFFELLKTEEPKGYTRKIKKELLKGADVNHLADGVSVIHLAAGLGPDLLRLMLHYGGDPNILSGDNETHLHMAASWGDSECVKLLLLNWADWRPRDMDGETALELVMEQRHIQCIEVLQTFENQGVTSLSACVGQQQARLSQNVCELHSVNQPYMHCTETPESKSIPINADTRSAKRGSQHILRGHE